MRRDSALWWLMLAGAACGYLATMPPPPQWTWAQWMQTATAGLAWLAGKLATSPLPGKGDQE